MLVLRESYREFGAKFYFYMFIKFLILYNLFWCSHQYKKRSYDPVDYEYIDKMDFWIDEEEEEDAELINGDMEEAICGEYGIPMMDESRIQS